MMKRCIKIQMSMIMLLGWSVWAGAQEKPTSVLAVSAEWEGYSQSDGSGLYWDVLQAAYAPVGITVNIQIVPWRRAQKMMEDHLADVIPALSPYTDTCCLFSEHLLDNGQIAAMFKPQNFPTWNGIESLQGKRVGWLRGYDYEKRLPFEVKKYEFESVESGLQILEKDRIDILLDYDYTIESAAENLNLDLNRFTIVEALPDPLYMGFSKTPRGQQLLEIYDKQIEALYQSGELQKIYQKWGFEFEQDQFLFRYVGTP